LTHMNTLLIMCNFKFKKVCQVFFYARMMEEKTHDNLYFFNIIYSENNVIDIHKETSDKTSNTFLEENG